MKTTEIRKYIEHHQLVEKGERVLVAYSGGPDSTFLLLELRKLYSGVSAVYVNHQLRSDESGREEEFVRNFCRRRRIPLFVERLQWKKIPSNLEETARKRRYACLAKTAAEHNFQKIALAHHLDDQIETFLLRLIRGSGPRGLAGMQPRRGIYIRPLLPFRKNEMIDSLKRDNIPFISDTSNSNLQMSRNRIRNELIPYLEKHFNPGFVEAAMRAISWIREQNQLASTLMERHFRIIHEKKNGEVRIEAAAFRRLPETVQKAVLREAIHRAHPFLPLSARTMGRLHRAIQNDGEMELPGYLTLLCTDKNILLTSKKERIGYYEISIPREGNYRFPPGGCVLKFSIQKDVAHRPGENTAYLDGEKASFPLFVRNWKKGDRFHPLGMKGSKKLSDYWIDRKVAKSDRKKIPLLFKEDDLAWIGGYQIDHEFRVTEKTRKVLKVEKLTGSGVIQSK